MRTWDRIGAIGLMCILAGVCGAGNGKSADGNGVKAASQLLAGVVHLSDNDIRFHAVAGTNVFVDPMAGPADPNVVKTGMVKPDLILITHAHADHFQPAVLQEYLKLNPKARLAGPADVVKLAREKGIADMNTVTPGQDYTLAGIRFHTVPAYFSDGNSHPQANQWVGYVLELNKARYYVTGDTQPLPEMAQVKADVLFPLLYGCGGNLDLAVKMAELSKARVVVPVHTSNQEETVKKYLAQLPKTAQGAYYKDGKLVVAR
jgi:L-ascorbate metabolism protein UlaG (beta-lactamase superfamily)